MLSFSVAALGLTFFSLNAAAVPLASPEAIASLMAKLPADHAAGLASLMARGSDPTANMSATIDSYILNLKQAGFVPNAQPTISKREALSLDTLVEKRSAPSMPLVLNLLADHGFVPTDATNSKRDIPDLDSALDKRTLPDVNLVISRLALHGFVPSGNKTGSANTKRDATSDINSVISQLEDYGFNPDDFTQDASALSPADTLSATTGVTCPQDDHKTFTTGKDSYEVLCSAGYDGYDLTNTHSNSLPDCLAACSAYVPSGNLQSRGPCVGASWLASFANANCFFKYDASKPGPDSRVVSGRKIS